jgi:Tfp pilus assembly protein PilP
MKRSPKILFCAFSTFCITATYGALVYAQDIDEPAGNVAEEEYEEYSYDEYDEGSSKESAESQKKPEPVASKNEATESSDEDTDTDTDSSSDTEESSGDETWDSYSDLKSGGSVAEEITDGVRIEDIVEPPSDYQYAAFGKADPFVPPILSYEEDNVAGSVEIPIVSPLQQFKLIDLKLVGVWQMSDGARKGMVITPTGNISVAQGIIIQNGDPIGNKGGKIIGVGEDYITVREFMLAPDGTREFEDSQMFMGSRTTDAVTGTITFKPGAKDPIVKLDLPEGLPGVAPTEGEPTTDEEALLPGNAAPENAQEAEALKKAEEKLIAEKNAAAEDNAVGNANVDVEKVDAVNVDANEVDANEVGAGN